MVSNGCCPLKGASAPRQVARELFVSTYYIVVPFLFVPNRRLHVYIKHQLHWFDTMYMYTTNIDSDVQIQTKEDSQSSTAVTTTVAFFSAANTTRRVFCPLQISNAYVGLGLPLQLVRQLQL
jgi:hypothetical protein